MIREYGNYSLTTHNTLGIEARSSRFIEYDTIEDLHRMIREERVKKPYLHIGGGSNLLFVKDYEGTILHSCIKGVEVQEETEESVLLKVGAGMVWDDFVAYCVERQWYGAENLSNIPGEVGASAVQNIGAYGVEAKDLITQVYLFSVKGEEKVLPNNACNFSYRHSIFKEPQMQGWFVTHVCFRLSKMPQYRLDYGTIREQLEKYPEVTLAVVREAIVTIRAAKLPDPAVLGNAGSFFMNPVVDKEVFEKIEARYPSVPHYQVGEERVKIPAAWLIEQSGWKGKTLGTVGMYEKQALVLVNRGGATGADVVALSDAVRRSVKEKFEIDIYPEVKFIS